MGRHRHSPSAYADRATRVLATGAFVDSSGSGLLIAAVAIRYAPQLAVTPGQVGVGLAMGSGLTLATLWVVARLSPRRIPLPAYLVVNIVRSLCALGYLAARGPLQVSAVTCLLLVADRVAPRLHRAVSEHALAGPAGTRAVATIASRRNVGLAVGVGVCGVTVGAGSPVAFRAVMIANALSFLITVPMLVRLNADTERAAAPARAVTRRRTAQWIIGFHGVSSFCYGLVFPYTGIFLTGRHGVGTHGVAVYYAAAGTANLAVALILAIGKVRPPPAALALTGIALSVAGYLTLPTVNSLPVVGLAAAATGVGQGCFLAAIIPIINSLVSEADRRQVFARRYQVLNATLAGGSLAAGGVISAWSRNVIPHLFVVNALGYLPLALTLLVTRRSSSGSGGRSTADEPTDQPALPVRALLTSAFAVSLFQLGVYLLGYSQFEATAPLVAATLMHINLSWISVLIAVNVATIVVAQRVMTRRLEPYPEVVGVRIAVGLWVLGYLVVGAMAFAPTGVRLVGMLLYGAIFGLGECAYSCSYHPWLISKVPARELTRANALSNSTMGIGLFFGPSIGVALIGTGSSAAVWLTLGALCAAVGLTTVRVRRRRTAAAPAARPADTAGAASARVEPTDEPIWRPAAIDVWRAATLELPMVRTAGAFQHPYYLTLAEPELNGPSHPRGAAVTTATR
ncbi:MAG: hypothetical protein QOE03_184 [Micromonosporaceae bacterium]|nr:hypothetical protein [Micromonosporaceae bacterium]